jgi:hypothetical protein
MFKSAKTVAITTEEAVVVEHKATGIEYTFYIGRSPDNRWFALTDQKAIPHFFLEALDKEDAYMLGMDAYNVYFEREINE